jgi:ATP-dependent exoDNAse (exonuclease V) beta subunit
VVWWDPRVLDREGEDSRGVRREELIAKDAAPADVRADRDRYEGWRERRAQVRTAGAQPSITVLTATEFARADTPATATDPASIGIADAGVIRPEIRTRPDAAARPSGRRFGILVHALLAAVPLDASSQAIRDLAEIQSRLLGVPDDERAEAAAIADRVISHPIVASAREAQAAGRAVRREAPASIVVGGALIDGQIDLAYDEGDGWVVVDFKTDAEIASAEPIYRRQVAVYVDAIARATGRPARGILLRV